MKCRHHAKRITHQIWTRRANLSSNLYQRSGGLLLNKTRANPPSSSPTNHGRYAVADDTKDSVLLDQKRNSPSIMEISVNELSAYQNDMRSLELFVDQLVHLPIQTFADHINRVLEMTKSHGLKGSRLAKRLLSMLDAAPKEASMAEISTAIANADFQQNLHIFNMKSEEFEAKFDIHQLETFVSQVEDAASNLTEEQLSRCVLPLSRTVAMKFHGVRGAQLMERLLVAVRQSPLKVSENFYNRSMIAWGNQTDSAEHVKRIWKYLEEDNDAAVLQRHYKSLIRGVAQADAPEAYHILRRQFEPAAGVPELLGEESAVSPGRQSKVEVPDLATYNLVAMAYAKSPVNHHPHKPMRVLEIMERVEKLHRVTNSHELDGHSYVALFLAHRKLLRLPSTDSVEIAQKIECLVEKLHERLKKPDDQAILQQRSKQKKKELDGNEYKDRDPDTLLFPLSMSWAYDIMIEAFLKSNQNEKATEVISNMMHGINGMYQCPPRNSSLIMLARKLNPEQRKTILKNCVLSKEYGRIYFLHKDMEDWASLPAPQPPYVAELVEAMLLHAFANFKATRNKPTGQTFRIAIKAWMRCGDVQMALSHMDNLMTEMMNVSKVDSWYAIKEVHVRLWMTSYLNLCQTGLRYAISGVNLYPAEHCERILKLVRPLCTRLNIEASFVAIVIRAWAKQEGDDINELERLQRVDTLLRSIKADEIPAYPANWVLTTCCRDFKGHEEQQKAYQIASTIFIRKDIQLNSRSYELMIEIVNKIRKDEVLVMELFRRACLAGLLSQEIVWKVAEIVTSAKDLQKLFHLDLSFAQMIIHHKDEFRSGKPPSALRLENLPPEWSINRDRKKQNEPRRSSKNAQGEDGNGQFESQDESDEGF